MTWLAAIDRFYVEHAPSLSPSRPAGSGPRAGGERRRPGLRLQFRPLVVDANLAALGVGG